MSSRADWRYPLALGATLLFLVVGAYIAFDALEPDVDPVQVVANTLPERLPPAVATTPAPVPDSARPVLDTLAGRPRTDTLAGRQRTDTLAGRRQPATTVAATKPITRMDRDPVKSPGTRAPVASPSLLRDPALALADSVHIMRSEGRMGEALRLVTAHLASSPQDRAMQREAARLSLATGDTAAAWGWYDALTLSTPDTASTSEYAGALLAHGRHGDAARRYQALLRIDPSRGDWRLAAAQGLAWGGSVPDALRMLSSGPVPQDTTVVVFRRSLRAGITPTEAEARQWVREDTADVDARLALARALARTSNPAAALREYLQVLSPQSRLPLVSEAAGVAGAAGDSLRAAELWSRASALAPADTQLMRLKAEALSWSGRPADALVTYNTLAAVAPGRHIMRARANVRVRLGDLAGATADLQSAEATETTPAGQVLLGDLHRWSGDRNASRAAYLRARALDPTIAGVREGLQHLASTAVRDLPWQLDEGTTTSVSSITDNLGFRSQVVRVQHGVPLGFQRRTIVLVAAEYRGVDNTSPAADATSVLRGADLGVTHDGGSWRLSARAGQVHPGNTGALTTWSGGFEWRPAQTSLTAQLSRGPAFETLRSPATLGSRLERALSATTAATTFARTWGSRAEFWSRAELLSLADDNTRLTTQLAFRAPLAAGWYAWYSGGWLQFADPSLAYWSPDWYLLQGLGLEYRYIATSGAYLTAGAQPGMAWLAQTLPAGGTERDRAVQWQLTAETGIRKSRWELTIAGGWGRDRDGIYSARTGLLRGRYRW